MALRDSVTTEQGAAHSAGPLALDVSTSVSPSPGREVVEGLMKRLGCVRVYEHIYICVCVHISVYVLVYKNSLICIRSFMDGSSFWYQEF